MTAVEELFTAEKLVEMTGVTYRRIDHWCRAGYLPEARPARGSGSVRLFNRTQVDTVGIALTLLDEGFTPGAALSIAGQLIENGRYVSSLADLVLTVDRRPTDDSSAVSPPPSDAAEAEPNGAKS